MERLRCLINFVLFTNYYYIELCVHNLQITKIPVMCSSHTVEGLATDMHGLRGKNAHTMFGDTTNIFSGL